MKISDIVAGYILDMMEKGDGNAEIKRNELALTIGCVPSQINYVITSRFTPEQGFIVESRRGGGGYIKITRVKTGRCAYLMHIINSIGSQLDNATSEAILYNILSQKFITEEVYILIKSALSDKAYYGLPIQYRDMIRASVFKNMLLTQI